MGSSNRTLFRLAVVATLSCTLPATATAECKFASMGATKGRIDELGVLTVRGIITNTSKRRLSLITVKFHVYDRSGNRVGTAADMISNLEPGSTWKFSAIAFEGGRSYRFDEINCM